MSLTLDQINMRTDSTPDLTNIKAASKKVNKVLSQKFDNNGASVAPSNSDDSSLGYEVGSKWLNVSTGIQYFCSDDTVDAAVWVPLGAGSEVKDATALPEPILSGATTGTEGADYILTIDNYDPSYIYSANPSTGTWKRSGNTITWTLGYSGGEIANIIVFGSKDGQTSSATKFIDIEVFGTVPDSALLYENTTMNEFTTLENTSIIDNKLVAGSGTRTLHVDNNNVYDDYLEVGDKVSLDGTDYDVTGIGTGIARVSSLSETLVDSYVSTGTIVGSYYDINDNFYEFTETTITNNDKEFTPLDIELVNIKNIFISDDGSLLFILSNDVLYFYNLNSNFDITSAVQYNSEDLTSYGTGILNVYFRLNGDLMFILRNGELKKYDLSTKYDVSTAVYNQTAPTYNGGPQAAFVSYDGMYYLATFQNSWPYFDKRIFTIPFDLSTLTTNNIINLGIIGTRIDGSNQISCDKFAREIWLRNTNKNAQRYYSPKSSSFFEGSPTNKLSQTSPIKPSTILSAELITKSAISNVVTQDVGEEDFNGISDIEMVSKFKNINSSYSSSNILRTFDDVNIGDKIIVKSQSFLNEYLIETITPSTVESIEMLHYSSDSTKLLETSGVLTSTSLRFGNNGTFLFTIGTWDGYPVVRRISLTNPYELNGESQDMMLTVNGNTQYSMKGFCLSVDGTKLYVSNFYSSSIHVWNMSTPWDLTTAVEGESLNLGSTVTEINISNDGYTIYYSNNNNYFLTKTLSTPWDITTAVNGTSLSFPVSRVYYTSFSLMGDKLYVGDGNINIIYELTTPWDITSITQIDYLNLSSVYKGFAFTDTYNKIFTIRDDINSIVQMSYGFLDINEINTTISTLGETPVVAFKYDNNLQFTVGNDFIKADNPTHTVLSYDANNVTVKTTFDNIVDPNGGRNLQTKVKMNSEGNEISKIYGVVSRNL